MGTVAGSPVVQTTNDYVVAGKLLPLSYSDMSPLDSFPAEIAGKVIYDHEGGNDQV